MRCIVNKMAQDEHKFTIDDAFESDEDDTIRIYGSTTESAPLRSKIYRPSNVNGDGDLEDIGGHNDSTVAILPDGRNRSRVTTSESLHSITSAISDSFTVSTKTYSDTSWWKHPKVRENWKIVAASFTLFIIGTVLLIVGLAIQFSKATAVQSFVFFIAGAICFIPGAYHVIYIYCAVKGKQGFSFRELPVLR